MVGLYKRGHVCSLCLVATFSLLQTISYCQRLDRRWTRSQGWGPWSAWSACSSTPCDHELSKRSRTCLDKIRPISINEPPGQQTNCSGTEVQYKVCDKQDCVGRDTYYRKEECEKQNLVPFRGRYYVWDPFVNPYNRCEVACQARVYRFYTGFGLPVKDGLPCDSEPDSNDVIKTRSVCLQGVCKEVGCDGVVGSTLRRDHCGVCGGDNDSCRIIAGIYTRTNHRYGYQQITQLPAGACHINVTELARSRNYLALQYTNGTNILNGIRSLSYAGNYPAAGTLFHYNRVSGIDCPGECLYAEGPLTVPLDLQLLTYRRNPGIKYMFTVPKDMIDTVMQSFNSPNNKQSATTGQDKSHDQAVGDRIGFKERPQYVAPYSNANLDTQPLQGTNYQHSTQDAIDRYHSEYGADSSTNKIDTPPVRRRPVIGSTSKIDTPPVRRRPVIGSNSRSTGSSPIRYSSVRGQTGYQSYSREYGNSNNNQQTDTFVARTPFNSVSLPEPLVESQPKLQISNTIDSVNFHWSIAGFTECSLTCGGGRQKTEIVCMKRQTNIVVTNENCDPADKPPLQTVTCNNIPCPPFWDVEDWSSCSKTCGTGLQTRTVQCKQRISSDLTVVVNERSCDTDQPTKSQRCQDQPCTDWLLGNWTECSVKCSIGRKSRTVNCVNTAGNLVADSECEGVKPPTSESCDMGLCAKGWYHTSWSEECSSDCGSGYYTRTVYCAAPDGSELPDEKCGEKPRTKRTCKNSQPCGGHWFEGPWSQCSATCGSSVKTRDVVCMKKLGDNLFAVVGEENCRGKETPITQKPCPDLLPCPSEWFNTKWSQCTKTCGTGVKSRDILCLDSRLNVSSSCKADDRPAVRRSCNTQSCDLPQLDEDPGCKDTGTRCRTVVQARLCKIPYFNSICCHSCALHKLKHKQQKLQKLKTS